MADKEKQFTRVPVKSQPRTAWYEMCMRFKGSAGIKSIDSMLLQCFPNEGLPRVKDAVTVRLRQVVQFVPDDETLAIYAKAVAESYSKGDTVLEDVRFDGYDYIYAVTEIPENGTENHE